MNSVTALARDSTQELPSRGMAPREFKSPSGERVDRLMRKRRLSEEAKQEGDKDQPLCKRVVVYVDGSRYDGEWSGRLRHGQGTMTFSNGDQYVGSWKNNERDGEGAQTWIDGSRYSGGFKGNLRHGYGEHSCLDGTRYEGTLEEGKLSGYGVYTWADGKRQY